MYENQANIALKRTLAKLIFSQSFTLKNLLPQDELKCYKFRKWLGKHWITFSFKKIFFDDINKQPLFFSFYLLDMIEMDEYAILDIALHGILPQQP